MIYFRSAHSQRTVKSTNSSGSSRIPIKRNSSLRSKKGEGKNRLKYKSSCTDEEEPQTLIIDDHDVPGNKSKIGIRILLKSESPKRVVARVAINMDILRPFLVILLSST